MRYFVLSDVHANKPALDAVWNDMHALSEPFKEGLDEIVCLGDVIGYGPDPNECMNFLWPRSKKVLIGNHEMSVHRCSTSLSDIATRDLNYEAGWAVRWTHDQLSAENRKRLSSLISDEQYTFSEGKVIFAHAAPFSAPSMPYIINGYDAWFEFFKNAESEGKICFVGHSHIPQLYLAEKIDRVNDEKCELNGGRLVWRICSSEPVPSFQGGQGDLFSGRKDFGKKEPEVSEFLLCRQTELNTPIEKKYNLSLYRSALVVVPGAGQPRDKFVYAGYAIYNSESGEVRIRRCSYDLVATQRKMQELRFPERLWKRLGEGR